MKTIRRFISAGLAVPVMVLTILYVQAAHGEVHEYKLENGLKLLVKEDHRAPVVVIHRKI